ncbi:MAG: FG-GAP repeat domain-containing protein [Sporichthyaceae bacterium]
MKAPRALLAAAAVAALTAGCAGPPGTAVADAVASYDPQPVPTPRTDRFAKPAGHGAGGAAPARGAVADLNGDGAPDLVVPLTNGGAVAVLLGDGAGGFLPATRFASGKATSALALADVDGDGDLDAAVGHHHVGNVVVLRGDGRGAFGKPERYDTSAKDTSGAPWVGFADVDVDGRPDIVVLGRELLVLRNTGDGEFAAPTRTALGRSGYASLALGDLDGDRYPDVALSMSPTGRLAVAYNDGAGGFAKPVAVQTATEEPPPPPAPACGGDGCAQAVGAFGWTQVAIGDVNADGRPDLALAHALTPGITLLTGDGAGGFAAARRVGEDAQGAAGLSIADLDGDGVLDLLALTGDRGLAMLRGLGGGMFADAERYATGRHGAEDNPYPGQGAMLGDFDGDDLPDVAISEVFANRVVVHRNTPAE